MITKDNWRMILKFQQLSVKLLIWLIKKPVKTKLKTPFKNNQHLNSKCLKSKISYPKNLQSQVMMIKNVKVHIFINKKEILNLKKMINIRN